MDKKPKIQVTNPRYAGAPPEMVVRAMLKQKRNEV